MNEIFVWKSRHDGVTHWATINDHPGVACVLRSFCGLQSPFPWERIYKADELEVTCPACQSEANRNVNGVPKAA